jgi:NADP-dependent 3-hydroxy acid dehydrogenase YdfG
MGLLDGKIALVTGAGTGIGRESAILLAQDGATVVLTGRRIEPLRDVVSVIEDAGGKAVARAMAVASREAILETVAWVKSNVGAIDILVNNAGSASKVLNARFLSEAEWNATINVNLTAVFNLTQAVLEDMIARKEGTIITVLFAGGRQSEPARWGRLRCSQGRCEEFHDLPAQHLS